MKIKIAHNRIIISILMMFLMHVSFGQVGIGTSSPNSESVLDLSGVNNKGLVLPTTNSTNPFNPTGTKEGVIMFNTNNKLIYYSTNLPSDYNTLSPWLYKPTPTDKEISLMDTENNSVLLKNTSLTKRVLLELDFGNINVKSGGDINVDKPGKIKEDGHDLVPAGCVMMWAGQNIPDGWFLCDGASKSKNNFPELFAALGYTYGGLGLSFNLPDFDDKFPKGNPTTNGSGNIGGQKEFAITKANLPPHKHSIAHGHSASSSSSGSHYHHVPFDNGGGGSYPPQTMNNPILHFDSGVWNPSPSYEGEISGASPNGNPKTTSSGSHSHSITVGSSSANSGDNSAEFKSQKIENEPPFLSIQYIIKY